MSQKRVLLIVSGGIAAYKSCELVRTIRKAGHAVRCVLTKGGAQFVTPLTLGALSEDKVYTDLFDLKDEAEMGHIQLSREADLVVVCPATADLLAKMNAGIADDLATTLLLATDKPVLAVPAMNVRMWEHPATRRNISALRADGVHVLDPDSGEMACGEYGPGRLPEVERIAAAIFSFFSSGSTQSELAASSESLAERLKSARQRAGFATAKAAADHIGISVATYIQHENGTRGFPATKAEQYAQAFGTTPEWLIFGREASRSRPKPLASQPDFADPGHRPLFGKRVLITAGPTHEPIDPVRYIANRSSGRQGFAIAQAAAEMGAEVTLVAGPVHLATPAGVVRIDVESAREMLTEVEKALPADVAIMVAAVADWRAADVPEQKIKKDGAAIPALNLTENPDILATLAKHAQRPRLLIGFAAETEKVVEHAQAKLAKKGCDWIVANDVSGDVMGGANNAVHIVTKQGVESLADAPKDVVARKLMEKIADAVGQG